MIAPAYADQLTRDLFKSYVATSFLDFPFPDLSLDFAVIDKMKMTMVKVNIFAQISGQLISSNP